MDEIKGTIRDTSRRLGYPHLTIFLKKDTASNNRTGHLLDSFAVWYFRAKRNVKVTLHPESERYGVSVRAEFEEVGQ